MDYSARLAFERRLTAYIESSSFHDAELWIEVGIAAAKDPELQAALQVPLDTMHIENWHSIANSMKIGNWRLPPSDHGWTLAHVHIGLLNHTGVEAPLAEVELGFLPMRRSGEKEHKVDYAVPTLGISGLEFAWRAQTKPPLEGETQEQMSERWRRQTLAAGIILLRFHQLVERHTAQTDFPRPVTIVAHVAQVTWPMEQGIYEFGTQATRRLESRDPQAGELFA